MDSMKIISTNIISENNNKEININCPDINFSNDIIIDSYSDVYLGHTFIVFKSFNNIFLLIYTNKKRSILSYDIINKQKINEIKNAHKKFISSFRYFLDQMNNRDLLLSISCDDNNIKIWNTNKYECLLDIKNVNKSGFLDSACILKDNNQIFIITSNKTISNRQKAESIKVFDFKRNNIKNINNSNEDIIFIDTYSDNNLSKIFIIACTSDNCKSYDYYKNEIYHKYSDNSRSCNIVINDKEEIVKLIKSCYNGNISIWDFHSGVLLDTIKVCTTILREICLYDNEYLFVGCDDKTIKLVKYKKWKVIKELNGHYNKVISIKKIIHPQYGKFLFSQGSGSDSIKLWIISN